MDPVTALSTAFTAIDLASRAAASLSDTDFRRRLAKRVGNLCEEHDRFTISKRALRRWLETDEAWEILKPLDLALQPELAKLLENAVVKSTRRGRSSSSSEASRIASILASRLMGEFLSSLDPNYAVAVLHQRVEKRLDDLEERLAGDLDLGSIPPACLESLARTYEASPDSARTVAQILARVEDVEELSSVVFSSPPPGWLSIGPPPVWVALGQFFSSHGSAEYALAAFRQAISNGAGNMYVLSARAALALSDTEPEEARRLIDEAVQAAPDNGLVSAVQANLNDEPEDVLTLLPDPFKVQGTDDQLLAVSLCAAAFAKSGRVTEAIDLLKRAVDVHPNRGSLRLRLADALVLSADGLSIGSADHDSLLLEAAQHAEAAIGLFRKWAGPSSQAVEVACGLYLSTGQLGKVAEIGRPPPRGTAVLDELTPRTQTAVAVALIASGDTEAAAEILAQGGATEFQSLFLQAEERAQLGDPDSTAFYIGALEAAGDDSERMFALMGLARTGSDELPGIENLRSTQPEWSALIEATAALNSDNPDLAAQITGEWRAKAAPHADLHARALAKKGETEAAISEYIAAAHGFGSAHFIAEAVDLLVESGVPGEAEALAARGLALFPGGQSARWRLRRQVLEIAEARGDWGTYESHARTLKAEFPDEPMSKWAVIYSLYIRQRRSDAWTEFQRLGSPPVVDERTAVMKVDLRSQFDPGQEVVEEALSLASDFPESEGVLGIALKASLMGAGVTPLPDDLSEEARRAFETFKEQFPDSELMRQVELDMDGLIESLRPILEPQARALDDVLRKIRFGELPGGIALSVRQLPYATYQALYGAGLLCSISPNPSVHAADRSAAEQALNSRVVIETSALIPAMFLDKDFWPPPRFSALLITDALRDDALAAVDEARSTVPTSMTWDVQQDRPVFHEAAQEDLDKNLRRVEALVGLLDRHCTPVNASAYRLEGVEKGDFEPWMSSLRLAKGEGVALFSEDLALRNLARGFGIPAFNSFALIEVLENQDLIDPETAEDHRRDLLRAFVMDLPLDENRIFEVAQENDFEAGPATAAFSRPAAWIDPVRSLDLFRRLISVLDDLNRLDRIPVWLAAASIGAALNAHPSKRASVLGLVLMSAIVHSGMGNDNAAELVEASRSVVQAAGLDPAQVDPLTEAIPLIRDVVARTVVSGQVGPMVLWIFRSLSEEDRFTVVRQLTT